MAKLDYLRRSIGHVLDRDRQRCPNCGGTGELVMRKYLVTALRRCGGCALQYRTPTDTPAQAESFYDDDYVQGLTTTLPSLDELERMKAANFAMLENDYNIFVETLRALGVPDGGKVFDYGCSWGYGSYVFAQAGFDVTSFEISRPRREFGREHLGVRLIDDLSALAVAKPGSFDVFFSSHVLEHVPSPSAVIADALRLLRPGGLLVSYFPNGSDAYRRADPVAWRQLWGEVHPNFLDDRFLAAALPGQVTVIAATPLGDPVAARAHLDSGMPGQRAINDLKGYELFVAARKAA